MCYSDLIKISNLRKEFKDDTLSFKIARFIVSFLPWTTYAFSVTFMTPFVELNAFSAK